MFSKNKLHKYTDFNLAVLRNISHLPRVLLVFLIISSYSEAQNCPCKAGPPSPDLSSVFCNQHNYFGFFLLTFLLGHHLLQQLHILCEVDRTLILYLGACTCKNPVSPAEQRP